MTIQRRRLFNALNQIQYLLNDTFTTDRAAGAVNGTASEPTGPARDLVDTGGNISIAGGYLVRAGGSVSDPVLRYAAPRTRVAGVILKWLSPVSGVSLVGYNAAVQTSAAEYLYSNSATSIVASLGAGTAVFGAPTYPLKLAMVTRATGTFFFAENKLLVIASSSTLALNVHVYSTGIIGNLIDYIRMPQDLWLPTPLASDGFGSIFGTTDGLGHAEGVAGGLGAGGGSLTWLANTNYTPTASVPTLGSEFSTNGDFESAFVAGLAPGWSKSLVTVTPSEEATIIHGGAKSQKFVGAVSNDGIFQYKTTTAGAWYQCSLWTNKEAAGNLLVIVVTNGGATTARAVTYTSTGWNQTLATFRATGASSGVYALQSGVTVVTAYMDDASYKPLTLSSLLSQATTYGQTNYITTCTPTLTAGTQAGVAVQVDDETNPTNGVFAYHNGTNIVLDKLVSGTWTNLSSSAATYSAGAVLSINKNGTSYEVIYNGARITGFITISDASITSGTKHCLFSTYASNTFGIFNISDYTTWRTASGRVLNTPTVGSDTVTNGSFTSDVTGWTASSSTLTSQTGGQSGNCLQILNSSATQGHAYQAQTTVLGTWYRQSFYQKNGTTTGIFRVGTTALGSDVAAGGTLNNASFGTQTILSWRALATTIYTRFSTSTLVLSDTTLFDEIVVTPLTTAEIFRSLTASTANVLAGVEMFGFAAGTQSGLALNLDSASNPQNFVIVYHNGSSVVVDKCVAGTYTSLATTAAAYSSGARLMVRKSGTAYRIYYNNALIGSELTISDAGIISNTLHGLFSTYQNQMDNFTVYATGDENQYNILERY